MLNVFCDECDCVCGGGVFDGDGCGECVGGCFEGLRESRARVRRRVVDVV